MTYYLCTATAEVVREDDDTEPCEECIPVVVINPEDGAMLSRLWRLLPDSLVSIDQMQAALREFANPPKPEEPTGLGAVVVDASNAKWILVYDETNDVRQWAEVGSVSVLSKWRAWDDITAVRVLNEGVVE